MSKLWILVWIFPAKLHTWFLKKTGWRLVKKMTENWDKLLGFYWTDSYPDKRKCF